MRFLQLYARSLALLRLERKQALLLTAAAIVVALFYVAQAILFAHFVEMLARLQPVATALAIWFVLVLAAVAANLWLASQSGRLAHKMRFDVMADYTEHTVAAAATHLSAGERRMQTEKLMRTVLRAADQLFFLWLNFFRTHLISFVIVLAVAVVSFSISSLMALLLVFLGVGHAAMNVSFARRAWREQMTFEKFHAHVAERASEVMNNAAVIQSYSRLSSEIGGLKQAMAHVLSAQFPILNWWARRSVLNGMAAPAALVITLAFGSYLYGEGRLDLGNVVMFGAFSLLLTLAIAQLSGFAVALLLQQDPLTDYFRVVDAQAALTKNNEAAVFQAGRMAIEFRDTRFSDGEAFSLSIPQQQLTVLAGDPDMTAKIVAALIRAAGPEAGELTIDGQDVSKVGLSSLRKHISHIPRDSGLLHRSVIENIMLGKPEATQDEVLQAAQAAEVHDFIAALPAGFHTQVTGSPQQFSDAERKQLLIARAILKDAPLIIYEDAEGESENRKLTRAFLNLAKERTVIVVSDTQAMLDRAKRVFTFEKGKLKTDAPGGEGGTASKKPERKKKTEAQF